MAEKPTSWGGVAEWYDRLLGGDDTYQRRVILPNLLRLVRPSDKDRILDLACGQGFFSHAFAEQGARVTGVDVAPELVAIAAKTAAKGKGRAEFSVAPSHSVPDVKDGSMDKAVVILAIQNIDDVKGTFAECARALVRGGTLHLVMNHPSFRIPKGSGWEWDKKGRQYRRIDRYMTEAKVAIAMRPGADPSETTVTFHRPLQFYVKALARAGFSLTNLEEWTSHKKSEPGPRAAEENRARKEIPLFLCIEARKD